MCVVSFALAWFDKVCFGMLFVSICDCLFVRVPFARVLGCSLILLLILCNGGLYFMLEVVLVAVCKWKLKGKGKKRNL